MLFSTHMRYNKGRYRHIFGWEDQVAESVCGTPQDWLDTVADQIPPYYLGSLPATGLTGGMKTNLDPQECLNKAWETLVTLCPQPSEATAKRRYITPAKLQWLQATCWLTVLKMEMAHPTNQEQLLVEGPQWISHGNQMVQAACEWNITFPKLPVYLQMHYNWWEMNQRVKDAVKRFKTEVQLLQGVNDQHTLLLSGNPNQTSAPKATDNFSDSGTSGHIDNGEDTSATHEIKVPDLVGWVHIDNGGPTMVWTVHIPFGQLLTPSHTLFDPTGTGTEHLAGFDSMENQTTHNLQYKHPLICRGHRWTLSKEHRLRCIWKWKEILEHWVGIPYVPVVKHCTFKIHSTADGTPVHQDWYALGSERKSWKVEWASPM
jgi:hypothetical protein